MDNPEQNQSKSGAEYHPEAELENLIEPESDARTELSPEAGFDSQPAPQGDFIPETEPSPETEPGSYVNETLRRSFNRVKHGVGQARDYYQRSPRLKKVAYQGKFLPAFWTVASIFSLIANIILVALLISVGRHFFALKAMVSDGLVSGLSENLALLDKAHIVTTVPVSTTVHLQDTLPVAFDVPIDQNTQMVLSQDTTVASTTYINQALVPLDVTLPKGTPITANINLTVPISQTIPLDVTVPISQVISLDVPIAETDLHQSIIGLQNTIGPYQGLLESNFNSPKEITLCNQWWSGWMCSIIFGK